MVPVIAPWQQLLKAHYRSQRHRAGVGYNRLGPEPESGFESESVQAAARQGLSEGGWLA